MSKKLEVVEPSSAERSNIFFHLAQKYAAQKEKDPAEAVPCLYIILRSDLASMTPGKAAAQAAHAANHLVHNFASDHWGVDWWLQEADGFGTTITLDGDEQDCITTVMRFKGTHACDVIVDPSYPIEDGGVTHKIELVTCAYIFVKNKDDKDDPVMEYLDTFGLYNGSKYSV